MSGCAIRLERLGKQYRIGARPSHRTLREAVAGAMHEPLTRLRRRWREERSESQRTDLLWALKDVSFDVPHGAVVGIVGPNGAGKSTLLKILSRITQPTEGRALVHGRLGSLLEVGTGFHSELTGRENVFLSGAVLGMRRAEMHRKFDAIADFAGVDAFLDTPVKHYSTGMYMRLAFAVAAHLEPEILVVDEVLSVGDAEFQKKCLGKMEDVARGGRTVLFVSHNLPTVQRLCDTAVLLRQGKVEAIGPPADILPRYLTGAGAVSCAEVDLTGHRNRTPDSTPVLRRLHLGSGSGAGLVSTGGTLALDVSFESMLPLRPVLDILVKTAGGVTLFGTNNQIAAGASAARAVRGGTLRCRFDSLALMPGTYVVDLYLHDGYDAIDSIEDAATFEVMPADANGTGRLWWDGPIWMPATFELREQSRVPEELAG